MLTISKPLSSGQAHSYHQREFSNSQDNYYTEGERVRGEWHGKLAEQWGLERRGTGRTLRAACRRTAPDYRDRPRSPPPRL